MYDRDIYVERIIPFISTPVIKIISGLRRIGKSYFLRQIEAHLRKTGTPKKNMLFVDKESLDFEEIAAYRDLNSLAKRHFKGVKGKKYLVVDEVQEIIEWEKAVTSILRQEDVDIYLTGSNARLLSSELATHLSGRYVEIPMYSLGFSEFLTFRDHQRESIEKEFQRFLRYGGFPAIHHFSLEDEIVYQYVNSIYNTVLLKDVVKRHQIRNVQLLENIVRFVFDNIGNVFSAKRIADYLKSQQLRVGVETIQNYIRFLESAYLIHKAPRYDMKGKRFLEIYDKYFLGEIGIRHSVMNYRDSDISGILENVVFLELKRQGFNVFVGKLGAREIDFVATRGEAKIYVQVAYLLSDTKTIEREFGVLQDVKDNYPKYVVSTDKLFPEDHQGIRHANIIDFLVHFRDIVDVKH